MDNVQLDPLAEKTWRAFRQLISKNECGWCTVEDISKLTGVEPAAVRGILYYDLEHRGLVRRANGEAQWYFTTPEHYNTEIT